MALSDFFRGVGSSMKDAAGAIRKSVFSDTLKGVLETAQTVAGIKTTIDQIRGKNQQQIIYAPPPPTRYPDYREPATKYGTRDEDQLYATRPDARQQPPYRPTDQRVELRGPRTPGVAPAPAAAAMTPVLIIGAVVLVGVVLLGGN